MASSAIFATLGGFHKPVKDDANCRFYSTPTLFCCNCKYSSTLLCSPYRSTVCNPCGHYSTDTLGTAKLSPSSILTTFLSVL